MSNTKLLQTEETAGEVRRLLSSGGVAKLAVAFWGDGANNKIGVTKRKEETRILCNLFSGGCNPDEIKKMLKPTVQMRYLNGLHAKLYWTRGGMVVGSSNASANGLGDEGTELNGNVGLNVLLRSPSMLQQAEKWFDRLWDENCANIVDKDTAEAARPAWRRFKQSTFLKALAANPNLFRGSKVRVLVYKDDFFNEDEQLSLERDLRAQDLFTKSELVKMDESGYYDFYLDGKEWPVNPGTIFIDFHWGSEKTSPKFQGIWRVRSQARWGKQRDGTRIVTCDSFDRLLGLRFPQSEQRDLAKNLHAYLKSKHLWGRHEKGRSHYNHLDMDLHKFWKVIQGPD